MDLDANSILIHLLITRLDAAKIGVVVRSIDEVDPAVVAPAVAEKLNRDLVVAAVNGLLPPASPRVTFASTIEAAVAWRNQAETHGRLLVFVATAVAKLTSLDTLDMVTVRDMTNHLLQWAEDVLHQSVPQQRTWAALKANAATLPFRLVLDFVRAVQADGEPDAMPRNMWRLGLLEDPWLLGAMHNPSERLSLARRRGGVRRLQGTRTAAPSGRLSL